jgi:HEAT repeat protein
LFDTICNQGSVSEATAFAVPYVIEVLAAPGVQGKDGILRLLACMAEARSVLDVHARTPDLLRRGPASLQKRADHVAKLAPELGWLRAACDAVEAGVGTYMDLLSDDEPEVRISAAYTLGQCQSGGADVVPVLIARIPSQSDARSQAALILALGSLKGTADEQRRIASLLAGRMGPEERSVVRFAAAMCLARVCPDEPAPEVLDTLTAAIGPASSDFERLPWCDDNAARSARHALAEYPVAQLRFLLRLLDNEDENIRGSARFAVEELCQERRSVTTCAAAALGERAFVGDLADRRGTVEILSRLGSAAARAAGPLRVALQDGDAQLRAHAAIALAGLHDTRAIPVLIALLKEERLYPKIIEARVGVQRGP